MDDDGIGDTIGDGIGAGLGALVPKGAAFLPVRQPGQTRAYAFVLVPGFTFLAFASAVEPLRIANQLSQAPLYRWRLLSETGAPVASSAGIPVGVDGPLAPQDKEVRLFVCAGNPATAAASPAVIAMVQRHHRFGGVVGGICTGAVALAGAGLLEGRRFTLHWENQPGFAETFPDLPPTASRFETDARIMTCGGGAAATDMMLSVIAEDHGPDFAAMVSDMCLRTVLPGVEPTQRSSMAALMSSRNPVLIAVVHLMNRHIDSPLSMDDLAEAAGYSRRHLERLFRDTTSQTPGEFYRGLRLDRGRNLLATTDLTLIEIATACGFDSVSHFSKSFRARFGVPPTKLKHGIGRARP
ncbi:MAG: GlxA family transcriptional regulator [Fuscovulum sp.]|jgi:AraC family carnitine catabolism transcriptional activator|nr:GlxA family transcriptional regulator [Fuscovulum sp.]